MAQLLVTVANSAPAEDIRKAFKLINGVTRSKTAKKSDDGKNQILLTISDDDHLTDIKKLVNMIKGVEEVKRTLTENERIDKYSRASINKALKALRETPDGEKELKTLSDLLKKIETTSKKQRNPQK